MNTLERLSSKFERRKANRDLVESQFKDLKKKTNKARIQKRNNQRALALVNEVALKTQAQLEEHLSEMTTMGLNSVFDDKYGFRVLFEIKRNKTECYLRFEKQGKLVDPLRFSGLGAADIAAFCLRCAAWSLDKRYRNVLILDEPFKHLKGEKENIRAIQLMSTLSKQLNLQIICVNDERMPREAIIENSDKVFLVNQNKKGISKVKEIK